MTHTEFKDCSKCNSSRPKTEGLILRKLYNAKDYPKYDNRNAINVDEIADIPMYYFDIMGVPVDFLDESAVCNFDILETFKPRMGDKKLPLRVLIRRR